MPGGCVWRTTEGPQEQTVQTVLQDSLIMLHTFQRCQRCVTGLTTSYELPNEEWGSLSLHGLLSLRESGGTHYGSLQPQTMGRKAQTVSRDVEGPRPHQRESAWGLGMEGNPWHWLAGLPSLICEFWPRLHLNKPRWAASEGQNL